MKPEEKTQFSAFLKYTGLFVFGYLLLLSLSYQASIYQPIVTLLTGIAIWFGAKSISYFYKKYGAIKTFLGIVAIGGAVRFLWAVFVPTLPVSDFQIFHENAIKLSQSIPISSKYMGYNLLLSAGYRVFPAVLTGKIINAAASTISLWLVYLLGSRFIDRKTGLAAAFLCAILPSEINMVSVLGTEVIATTLGLVTAFLLLRATNGSFHTSKILILCAGFFYGLGITFRSSLIFYLPAIALFIFFVGYPNIGSSGFAALLPPKAGGVKGPGSLPWKVPYFKEKVYASGVFLTGIATGLAFIVASYSLSVGSISLEPLRAQDTVIGFLIGTNTETSGTWNLGDNDLYYSWPASERSRSVLREALNRIASNPADFLLLIPRKISVLMAANDYGNAWSLYAIDWGEGNLWGVHALPGDRNLGKYSNLQNTVISVNGLLSQAVYVFIWLFALYTFVNFGSSRSLEIYAESSLSLVVLMLVLFTLFPHIILEVQGRYHHTLMPFIALLAACGLRQKQEDVEVVSLV